MKARPGVKHIRALEGCDVAACGARDSGIAFAARTLDITCQACKEKRAKRMLTPKFLRNQAAARKAYLDARGASRLTDS